MANPVPPPPRPPSFVSGAPAPAKKISFTRFTLNARHKTDAAQNHSPLHAHRAHQHSTHHASFQNLKAIFKAPPKPAPVPFKSKRFAPSPLSRYLHLHLIVVPTPPTPTRTVRVKAKTIATTKTTKCKKRWLPPHDGPLFTKLPPAPAETVVPRPLALAFRAYEVRACVACVAFDPRFAGFGSCPSDDADDHVLGSFVTDAPDAALPNRRPPLPLTSHPSFLRLRRARPALLEEEDNRPSEPPVTIYPRMGDLRSLHEKGEWGVKVDRGFGGVGVWTLRKIVWIREVQEVQVRLEVQEATGRELEEQRSSASASETEDEDEDEEMLVDSDSEWDSISTTFSSQQGSGETDAGGSEVGVVGKGNLIEMAVGQVNSAGKGGDERSEEDVDVETRHMASSAWLCAFYRASAGPSSPSRRRGQRQGQCQGHSQIRGHVHSQMQWQSRRIVLLEIARRDGVRIKVVKAAPSAGEMREKVGGGCEVVEAFGEV
ncbi:hypothetical protein D9611_002098 [Ephemerocybe angulata]|uniref:Uncharacterized protein n=1 Tax=Ephemerocybe angulata TaxID=980116 RepID=A0A8H5CIP5_9AGAR|nr:hypothetical protein D9611_002098 [Tulosesus angulatus]